MKLQMKPLTERQRHTISCMFKSKEINTKTDSRNYQIKTNQ